MIEATRLAPHAALRLRTRPWSPWHLPATVARASSLSAIHRGIHRGNRIDRRDAKGRPDLKPGKYATGRAASEESYAQKVQRAIASDAEESTGKQTRRKRFLDPNSSFGKKSLVYRVKFGDLKEKADNILAKDAEEHSQRGWNAGAERSRSSRPADAREERRESASSSWETEYSRVPAGGRGREREGAASRGRMREDASAVWARRPRRREDDMGSEKPKPDRRREPISLGRATAASQFLFGTAVINAALSARRRKLYRLYVLNTGKRAQEIEDQRNNPQILAKQSGVPVTFIDQQKGSLMDKMSGGRPHNGYILEASPLPQLPITALAPWTPGQPKPVIEVVLGRQSKEDESVNGKNPIVPYRRNKQQKPFVVLLHEVLDPGNLGAMIRSAGFLGASAVAITTGGSATLTPVASKAAAGAAEEIPIFTVASDMDFVTASQKAGWRFYAAAPPSLHKDSRKTTAAKIEKENPLAKSPCVLVLGSEGKGLPKTLRRAVDFEISIPGASKASSVDSLNVSVAGGILCNAFLNPSSTQPTRETSGQEMPSAAEPPVTAEEQQVEGVTTSEGDAVEEKSDETMGKGEEVADGEKRIF